VNGATFGPGTLEFSGGSYYATAPTTGWGVRIDDIALWVE
jgi:hypothetical protein